jgi:hypothetical protein
VPAKPLGIVQLLVARVDISTDRPDMYFRTNGTYRQLASIALPQEAAA